MGPRVDHTLRSAYGHYLLYDGSSTYQTNPVVVSTDKINVPPYTTSKIACLSVWYYIDSESKFNLSVGYYPVLNPTIFMWSHRVSGTIVSHSWKQLLTNIWIIPGNSLSIQLQHSIPFIGGVALDDIKLTPGECKYDTGTECDFEVDYCGYQVSLYF